MGIKKGDIIKVQYTGTFDDGAVFDSSETHGKPMKFQVGSGQLIMGFDNSVMGKDVGDEFSIKLQPAEAYGEYQEGMSQKIPRDQFPKDAEPELGMMLQVMSPDGHAAIATITEVSEDDITLNLNHPMAGKVLNFKIKIIETGCEPDAPSECGCGHDH